MLGCDLGQKGHRANKHDLQPLRVDSLTRGSRSEGVGISAGGEPDMGLFRMWGHWT